MPKNKQQESLKNSPKSDKSGATSQTKGAPPQSGKSETQAKAAKR